MSNQSDDSSFNTSSWDEAVIRRMDSFVAKAGGGRVSSSSLSESMGSMVTIGEGFNLGKREGMMI